MRTRSIWTASVLAFGLVAAGCGGADGEDASGDSAADEAETEATDEDVPEESDAAEEDTAGDTDAADEPDAPDETDAPEETEEAETEDMEAAGDADVAVAMTDLGEVLVDGEGMTLYLFTNDPEGESVCEDDCATAWPPLTVEGEPTAGEDVDAELLGTIERSDGSTQVTYGGAPLYTWSSDSEPGDVTGQGVNDVWYVVSPDGEAIMEG